MFKKDMWIVTGLLTDDWSGKLVNVSIWDNEFELFVSWYLWLTTKVFKSSKTSLVLKTLSNDYKTKEIEDLKTNQIIYSDEYFTKIIEEWFKLMDVFSVEEFDRYEENLVCPNDKVIGIWIPLLNKLEKLFSKEHVRIDYYFYNAYIIGRSYTTSEPLFIIRWGNMPRQISLLSIPEEQTRLW